MQIKNEKLKKAILTSLADEEMLKIINISKESLVSGNEIIKKLDISHSTAYRKIKWMLDNELLVVEKMDFTPDGKKFSLFRSTIRSVNIKYEGTSIVVEAEKNANLFENATKRFFSMESI